MKKINIAQIRPDLQIVANLIKPSSSVIDIGCGDGELLQYLRDNKKAETRGIEISQAQVSKALMRGLSVIQGDAQSDLAHYPDESFDYAILSHTIQNTQKPKEVLQEMLRIAKFAIVSLPNFAHYRNRFHLMFKGYMPVNRVIPYEWYETPNIRFCAIKDFENLCQKLHFKIKEEIFISGQHRFGRILSNKFFANLFAEYGIFVIIKDDLASSAEVEFISNHKIFFERKISPQFALDINE